ncbi:hypothetical protein DPX16_16653 [Anabarilius grahami]|uniref:Retrotransposon gag domain-containing protein n=1 Tax=Anabarilius grahami TaxID=495550 RepID=A0A3N0YTL1_ANAGA|nr:hypothetical protein DPX16_16653 [Anabarilius grahami]
MTNNRELVTNNWDSDQEQTRQPRTNSKQRSDNEMRMRIVIVTDGTGQRSWRSTCRLYYYERSRTGRGQTPANRCKRARQKSNPKHRLWSRQAANDHQTKKQSRVKNTGKARNKEHGDKVENKAKEYSTKHGSSSFSEGHWPGMNTARNLLALRQGPRSLENYVCKFLAITNFSDLPDCVLIDFFCDGINQPLQYELRREGPRSSLSCFWDFALLTVGSLFTVGVADEVRDIAFRPVMAATAEPVGKMGKTITPHSQVKSQLIFVSQVKSLLIFVNPVKSQLIFVSQVKSQLVFVSQVKSPLIFQSHVTSPLIFQSHVTSPMIFQSHVTSPLIFQSHFSAKMAATPEPSAKMAATPEPSEISALAIMATAIWCVWAAYTSAPVHESATEPAPVHESAPEPDPAHDFTPEPASTYESNPESTSVHESTPEFAEVPQPSLMGYGLPVCLDTTTEVVPEFPVCLDTTMEVVSEFPVCLDMTAEVIPELSVCPDATAEVVPELSAHRCMTREDVPVRALEGFSELPSCI